MAPQERNTEREREIGNSITTSLTIRPTSCSYVTMFYLVCHLLLLRDFHVIVKGNKFHIQAQRPIKLERLVAVEHRIRVVRQIENVA